MEAFRAAVEAGVDQVETDIRITADGALVLIHDATLERTTNGTGRVDAHTLPELRALDAGSFKGAEFAGCRIPTLDEFIAYVKPFEALTLDLELKEYPTTGHEKVAYEVCDRVLAIVEENGLTDRVVINTFSGKLHEYIYRKYGKRFRQHVYFPMHHLGECELDPYSYGYCCCMFSERGELMADAAEFAKMAARGVEPWAGASVKNEEGVQAAIDAGAKLITCNNADDILKILADKGMRNE
jgi:glycerophosphoryl diester phosphodiesterase